MKLIPSMIFTVLCTLTIAVPATAHPHHCKCGATAPAPPTPPNAPLPPSEPGIPAMPPIPAMPAPPAPPAPPPPPDAPAEAHAACAAKAPGTKLTFSGKRGTTMSGTCERDNRGMYFEITSIHSAN